MRNYGNKGLVVGERWLLLTVNLKKKQILPHQNLFWSQKRGKSRQRFQNEKLWEQGFGSREEVAAIDSG